ncbi:hypothetical protein SAMN02745220_00114 [Desulfopila aestuarii DSM 18488]|uniref:Uncharacterized protein n=1 Tax=Desulfopila aestuarii DSM 18488 TaxID=1121416 RepID=A0A1M7XW03_9BACT|nr:hypothetical protein SAMN02745220_00114 [Desulfopila aestuarii DSM 18488]
MSRCRSRLPVHVATMLIMDDLVVLAFIVVLFSTLNATGHAKMARKLESKAYRL